MTVRVCDGELVYLDVVRVSRWLYCCVPVVSMSRHIVPESGSQRFDKTLGLTASQKVVRYCCKVLGAKESVQSCENFGHKLHAPDSRKKERRVVRSRPMFNKGVRNMRRDGSRRRDSSNTFGVTIRGYNEMLASFCCFWKWA